MANTGRKSRPPTQPQEKPRGKSKKPAPSPRAEDEDYEDGDIATPKRDRHGTDDEPCD
jgi:hypothetical protein